MRRYDRNVKKSHYYIAILVTIFVMVFLGIFLYEWKEEEKKYRWVRLQRENLEYIFDESAPCRVLELSEIEKLYHKAYETTYDFDGDQIAEAVQIAFERQADQKIVTIMVEGMEPVSVKLDCPDGYQRSCVITGIEGENGNSLGIVESVFAPEEGKGYLNCHIFSVKEQSFVKSVDYTYSGMIAGYGIMIEGVIENAMPGNEYVYDVTTHQNDYIYERSVMFANMKDMGLRFPHETMGKFQMRYKRNVTGLFYVIAY